MTRNSTTAAAAAAAATEMGADTLCSRFRSDRKLPRAALMRTLLRLGARGIGSEAFTQALQTMAEAAQAAQQHLANVNRRLLVAGELLHVAA